MHIKKISQLVLGVSAAVMMAACGGGGDGDGGDRDGGIQSSPAGDSSAKPQQPVSSGAHPLNLINYANAEIYTLSSIVQSQAAFCNASATKAYGGHNTATFAQAGVSDARLEQIARYAEASALYIKSKLGLDSSTEGFGDNQTISVCVLANKTGGSGFHNSMEVGELDNGDEYDEPDEQVKRLVLHEMIHVMHARLANCQNTGDSYGIISKWFSEGSALYLANQDRYYTGDLADMRKMSSENPYSWTANGYPVSERYPVYRLAVEALVDASGKTEDDLWKFTKDYFAKNNQCNPQGYNSFNAAISASFGNLLENSEYISKFWTTTLDKYALPE